MPKIDKSIEEERLVVARGCEKGAMENDCKWASLFFTFLLKLDHMMVAQLCDDTENHLIVHFQRVTFMACDYISIFLKSQCIYKKKLAQVSGHAAEPPKQSHF